MSASFISASSLLVDYLFQISMMLLKIKSLNQAVYSTSAPKLNSNASQRFAKRIIYNIYPETLFHI